VKQANVFPPPEKRADAATAVSLPVLMVSSPNAVRIARKIQKSTALLELGGA
jgi:hypothetical protein